MTPRITQPGRRDSLNRVTRATAPRPPNKPDLGIMHLNGTVHLSPYCPVLQYSLRFPPMASSGAFGFVDPSTVLRGCHIVPACASGQLHSDGIALSRCARDGKDWLQYYANRFADRDMLMRYHHGLAVGHVYTVGAESVNTAAAAAFNADQTEHDAPGGSHTEHEQEPHRHDQQPVQTTQLGEEISQIGPPGEELDPDPDDPTLTLDDLHDDLADATDTGSSSTSSDDEVDHSDDPDVATFHAPAPNFNVRRSAKPGVRTAEGIGAIQSHQHGPAYEDDGGISLDDSDNEGEPPEHYDDDEGEEEDNLPPPAHLYIDPAELHTSHSHEALP
ncbi:hypothetical protein HWV62_41270 [Athelia sp. TMB]|nr:hypothetical protein HWV62_41270 [Athelia sp. TMB]